jgi:hypothetical protein
MLAATSRAASRMLATRASPAVGQMIQARSYHENIVEHYENPRNVGSLDKNDTSVGTVCVFVSCYSWIFLIAMGNIASQVSFLEYVVQFSIELVMPSSKDARRRIASNIDDGSSCYRYQGNTSSDDVSTILWSHISPSSTLYSFRV